MDKFPENPTDEQIADACMWLSHDFGLLSEFVRLKEMAAMKRHWIAVWKAVHTPGSGGQFVPQKLQETPNA